MIDPLIKEKAKYSVEKSVFETTNTFFQFTPIGRVLFIVFLLGMIPAYFGSRYATQLYFDQIYSSKIIQAKQSTVLASPVVVSSVGLLQTSATSYAAYATITNPNLDVAINVTPYTIRFYNNAGTVVTSQKGNFYILPNGQFSVVVPRIDSVTVLTNAKIEIGETHFQKRLNIAKVDIQTPTPGFYNQQDPQAFVVEGGIYNNSAYSLRQVSVKFFVYNKAGQLILISSREESSLRPFERRAYKQLWPGAARGDVGSVKVVADTNVLDFDNLRLQVDTSRVNQEER